MQFLHIVEISLLIEDKMKLNKKEVHSISNFLHWSESDTLKAIKITRDLNLFIDSDDLLRICIEADHESRRASKLAFYLLDKAPEDTSEYIRQLILDENIFYICTMFNAIEAAETIYNTKLEIPYDEKYSNLITPFYLSEDIFNVEGNLIFSSLKHRDQTKIFKFHTIDILVISLMGKNRDQREFKDPNFLNTYYENFILEMIPTTGFQIFELPFVRTFVNEIKVGDDNEAFLKKIVDLMSDSYLSRNEQTQKKYWLIFCLVEKLKENKKGTMESFRLASKLIGLGDLTIQRRYYEMKKKKAKLSLSVNEIIKQQGLQRKLIELMQYSDTKPSQ